MPSEENSTAGNTDSEPQTSGTDDKLAQIYDSGSTEDEEVWDPEPNDELGGRMTFLEHLDEFRRRLIYSALAIFIAFCGAWVFREPIFQFLAAPIFEATGGELLKTTRPTDSFTIYLKTSFVVGLFLASPVVIFQLWLFIAPGLYRNEKRFAIPFLVASSGLFILGGAFAYLILLPVALDFLINTMGRNFEALITAIDYFSFETLILVGMGVIFQMPVLAAFLAMFGILKAGFLWRNFRYAFLMIVVIAAVISPTTDVISLGLYCAPMVLLYLVSIVVVWVFQRRRRRAEL